MQTIAPYKITVCGIEELGGHCEARVSHVLSILDPNWPVPEAFGAFGEHEKLELRFHDVIEETVRAVPPRRDHVVQLLAFGRDLMVEPSLEAHLLVHCHAGVSRSTAAMALILAQALPDRPAGGILRHVLQIRRQAWPNLRMVELGDALLGRRGELVSAVHEVYRAQLEARPHLREVMIQSGRTREIEAARIADTLDGLEPGQ
jgi:predicted protein tyrosine phosphatase